MGEDLIREIVVATGLPQEIVAKELLQLISVAGGDPSNMTLEELRQILADYVQDVLLTAKENLTPSGEA